MISQRIFNPLFILIIGAILLSIVSFSDVPIGNDEGVWGYVGRAWAEDGLLPYSGILDNKAPGIYYLNYISYLLFGVNLWFMRFLALITTIATAYLIYLLVKKIANNQAAVFAMAIFLFLSPLPAFDGAYAQTETFMNLFVVSSFYFMNVLIAGRKRFAGLALSGLCCGLAIAFRQSAVVSIIPLLVNSAFLENYNLRRALASSGIFISGVAASIALGIFPYYLGGGRFIDYLNGAWLLLFLQRVAGAVAGGGLLHRFSGFTLHFFIPEMAILVSSVAVFIVYLRKIRNSGFLFAATLLVWVLSDFFSYNLQGTYFAHHLKLLMLSWSVCFGVVADFFLRKFFPEAESNSNRTLYGSFLILSLIILYVVFQNSYPATIRNALKGVNDHDFKNIGLLVRDITKPGDTIYVYGLHTGPIYYYSSRNSPSRYFESSFLKIPSASAELRTKLLTEKPSAVLTLRNDDTIPSWLSELIANNYRLTAQQNDYNIYTQ